MQQALPHIFDKFYQADSSHSGNGNGLGLAIAKKIALLHGGDIAFMRSDEYGTFFVSLFPNNFIKLSPDGHIVGLLFSIIMQIKTKTGGNINGKKIKKQSG